MIFFSQGLGIHGIEYRDDEIFYFKSTSEMLRDNNFLSPTYFGQDRFQKPILFYWLIIIFYKIFGMTWFAARFASVIFASLTVCMTWTIVRELFDRDTATISSLILMTIPLFFRHAKNAVPDMALNFFVVFALYCAMKFIRNSDDKRYRYLFFVSCALGFMIKGFAALIIPVVSLITYSLLSKRANILKKINFPVGILIILVIALPWFIYMAVRHGSGYMDYVLKAETYNRMVSSDNQNILIKLLGTFLRNALFYLETLMSYFAPWSTFIIAAIPLGLRAVIKQVDKRESVFFVLNWFFVVFLFFSLIHARINHLILVLSTPCVILMGMFLVGNLDFGTRAKKIMTVARKVVYFIIVFSGILGLVFLHIFLIGSTKLWLVFFILLLGGVMYIIFSRRKEFYVALSVCIFMVFSYSQAHLLSRAKLTSHACLQSFAQTIKNEDDGSAVVGVGSHDIHEKEWQVYFDRHIQKTATSDSEQTKQRLNALFANPLRVYCLITENDRKNLINDILWNDAAIIQQEYTFRRRMNIDKGFFSALVRLDQNAIKGYLMEKIILLRKEHDA